MDSQLENECSRRIHRPKYISGENSVEFGQIDMVFIFT